MRKIIYSSILRTLLMTVVFLGAVGFISAPQFASANSLPFYWADTQGGAGADEAVQVAVAGTGESYVVGEYYDSGDFDPGAGTTTLTSAGNSDVYIVKYNSDGSLGWAKSIGGTNYDDVTGVVLSPDGGVIVTGFFLGTLDADPGAGTANISAGVTYAGYVLKLTSSGNYSWAKAFPSSGMAFALNATTDGSDNVYFTGNYEGTMDADPGAGTTNITSNGDRDIFIIKLDSTGVFTWAKSIGGTGSDHGNAITDDGSNIYITGMFEGTMDADPGAGTTNLVSNGGRDIFVLKLTTAGVFSVAKSAGGSGFDSGQDIVVANGGIYMTGSFNDTVDFDPGVGTSNATSAGGDDVFVWKLSTSGTFSWIQTFGGPDEDSGNGISINDFGDIVVVGSYFDTIDLDPGSGVESYSAGGGQSNGFVSLLYSDGSFAWGMNIGGDGIDAVNDIGLDAYPDWTIVGKFTGADTEFDGTDSINTLSSNSGSVDGFTAKYHLAYNPYLDETIVDLVNSTSVTLTSAITDIAGDTVTSRGFQYSIDNSYSDSVSEDGSYDAESFTLQATSLVCDTTYNVRSFAESSAGIGTGTETTFTTSACPVSGSSKGGNTKPTLPSLPAVVTPPVVDAIPSLVVTNVPSLVAPYLKFNRNLSAGMNSEDVKALQMFLNQNKFTVSESGGGSAGQETTYFGPKTKAALIKFQEYYHADILDPLGLPKGTGYLGEKTRSYLNSIAK